MDVFIEDQGISKMGTNVYSRSRVEGERIPWRDVANKRVNQDGLGTAVESQAMNIQEEKQEMSGGDYGGLGFQTTLREVHIEGSNKIQMNNVFNGKQERSEIWSPFINEVLMNSNFG